MATTIPTLMAYDPAFAYEIAVIVQDGMRRMYQDGEDVFYYLSLYNENYLMPPMPEGVEDGILKGSISSAKAQKGRNTKRIFLGAARSSGRRCARRRFWRRSTTCQPMCGAPRATSC